jgi:hypothetical protein
MIMDIGKGTISIIVILIGAIIISLIGIYDSYWSIPQLVSKSPEIQVLEVIPVECHSWHETIVFLDQNHNRREITNISNLREYDTIFEDLISHGTKIKLTLAKKTYKDGDLEKNILSIQSVE